jgi:AcrR family transcriptional regulator
VTPEPKRRQRAPHQLPPGRHGLPRSFVISNQRERILAAVADVVGRSGYADMRVEDVVVAAGVSRRTFYDHFSDKEAAFLAAYDAVVGQLLNRIREAYEAEDDFVGRVRASLETFVDFVASDPSFADMAIVEVLAAGPEAVSRRNNAMAMLAQLIQSAADELLPKRGRPPVLTAEAIVGGVYEVVYSRVLQDQASELPELLPDLVHSVLLPYVGPEKAGAESRRLRRRAATRRKRESAS